MVDDLEEFKRLIKEKGISEVEPMLEESMKLVKMIPNFKKKFKKGIQARGYVLEKCTLIEVAFNELITKTGGGLDIDSEKGELKLTTGIKTERELGGIPTFKKRAEVVKTLMVKILDNPQDVSSYPLMDKIDRLVAIRDIFAHVPINWIPEEPEFTGSLVYKHFFEINPQWRNISVVTKEFVEIEREVLEAIPKYIKLVLYNEKLIASLFLGTDFREPAEEDKK